MKISSPKAINWTLKQYGYTDRTRIKFFDRILTSNPNNKISNVLSGAGSAKIPEAEPPTPPNPFTHPSRSAVEANKTENPSSPYPRRVGLDGGRRG
jgi:hypothetical protein